MLQIRQANVDDAATIAALNMPVQQLHYEARPDMFKLPSDGEDMVAYFESVLEKPDCVLLIGEVEGAPVGYVFAQIHRRPEHPFGYARNYVYIDQISVNPDQRGKGYGKQLTEAVFDLARAQGIKNVTLSVWLFNSGAIEFYEKLGFSVLIQSMGMTLD